MSRLLKQEHYEEIFQVISIDNIIQKLLHSKVKDIIAHDFDSQFFFKE